MCSRVRRTLPSLTVKDSSLGRTCQPMEAPKRRAAQTICSALRDAFPLSAARGIRDGMRDTVRSARSKDPEKPPGDEGRGSGHETGSAREAVGLGCGRAAATFVMKMWWLSSSFSCHSMSSPCATTRLVRHGDHPSDRYARPRSSPRKAVIWRPSARVTPGLARGRRIQQPPRRRTLPASPKLRAPFRSALKGARARLGTLRARCRRARQARGGRARAEPRGRGCRGRRRAG